MIPPLSNLKPQSRDTNCTIHDMTFDWEDECPGCIEDELTQEAIKFDSMLNWAEQQGLKFDLSDTPHIASNDDIPFYS